MGIFKNLFNKKQVSIAERIINQFYFDYPEKPYISAERKEEWIETALLFRKTALVQKTMMQRYSNGLLPGHIYMLYWLNKNTNKKTPSYFEYKYGIDFEKEKIFLYTNGYLNELNKPTEKGKRAIQEHYDVIESHTPPKPDRSIEGISKQVLVLRDNISKNGFKEYEFMANSNCCDICKALNGKHFLISDFKIGVNAPPMHEGCACTIAPYEDREEYEKWLNSL